MRRPLAIYFHGFNVSSRDKRLAELQDRFAEMGIELIAPDWDGGNITRHVVPSLLTALIQTPVAPSTALTTFLKTHKSAMDHFRRIRAQAHAGGFAYGAKTLPRVVRGREFFLLGHSLGTEFLTYAFCALAAEGSAAALSRFRGILLMGGTAGKGLSRITGRARAAAVGHICNLYSPKDWILSELFLDYDGGQTSPCGLAPLPRGLKPLNGKRDFTHSQYLDDVDWIVTHVWSGLSGTCGRSNGGRR